MITVNGLNEAKNALVNGKVQKTLAVINLTEIKYCNLFKGESKWINANLIESKDFENADHFSFGFLTKYSHDILNFTFLLLDGNLIRFNQNEKKVPVLDFKIQIVK